jgi:ketosteroid isomerase-like protein
MRSLLTRETLAFLAFTLVLSAAPAFAQTAAEDEAAIRSAITSQAGEWNRGNIDGFMQAYENSDETIFVGQARHKGYTDVLNRYKAAYNGPAEMGQLTFSDLDIRLLPNGCGKTELALATGKYHLENTTKPKKDGVFSLVWRKGPQGWKIILDHTS